MKTNLYKHATLLLLTAIVLCSCSKKEGAIYEESLDAYGFERTELTKTLSAQDNGTFTVLIHRANRGEAAEISINRKSEKPNNPFTIDSKVSFKQGESIAAINVSFNLQELSPVDVYVDTLSLGDGLVTTPAGSNTVVLSISRLLTYDKIGVGLFSSEFWGASDFELNVYRAQEANVYKFEAPYEYEGFDIVFGMNNDNTEVTTFNTQKTGYIYGGVMVLMEKPTQIKVDGKTVTVTSNFVAPGLGSFGTYTETFVLP